MQETAWPRRAIYVEMRFKLVICVSLLVVVVMVIPAVRGFCCSQDSTNWKCDDCGELMCYATGPCNLFCCNCDGCCRNNQGFCSFTGERNSSKAHYITYIADTDKDGLMSLQEAMQYLGLKHGTSYIRLMEEELNYLDKNKDGYLSAYEID